MNNKIILVFCIGILLITLIFLLKKQYIYASDKDVPSDFYNIQIDNIDRKALKLKTFKNKPILIVNVASRCGFTGQYSGLEELYQTYKEKGLVIIGVPTNDFGGQEPGTEENIKTFCQTTYGVSFTMTEKVSTRGKNQHPLFTFLTQSNPELKGPVSWNFNKFLISKEGKLINRFGSNTKPLSKKLTASIDAELK